MKDLNNSQVELETWFRQRDTGDETVSGQANTFENEIPFRAISGQAFLFQIIFTLIKMQ